MKYLKDPARIKSKTDLKLAGETILMMIPLIGDYRIHNFFKKCRAHNKEFEKRIEYRRTVNANFKKTIEYARKELGDKRIRLPPDENAPVYREQREEIENLEKAIVESKFMNSKLIEGIIISAKYCIYADLFLMWYLSTR